MAPLSGLYLQATRLRTLWGQPGGPQLKAGAGCARVADADTFGPSGRQGRAKHGARPSTSTAQCRPDAQCVAPIEAKGGSKQERGPVQANARTACLNPRRDSSRAKRNAMPPRKGIWWGMEPQRVRAKVVARTRKLAMPKPWSRKYEISEGGHKLM